ncbi:hypothetical protein B0J11DRAFT_511951 [Dendryphion nanum]|uniref:Uncharacterized protein n=1 Tax=Dendryphion nanum TaxID=256645 RepID=A0A9P9D3Q8_9PLEO|nr:hypothetical protein B0J11DRAFT_511951 [Dendryphion nanum]
MVHSRKRRHSLSPSTSTASAPTKKKREIEFKIPSSNPELQSWRKEQSESLIQIGIETDLGYDVVCDYMAATPLFRTAPILKNYCITPISIVLPGEHVDDYMLHTVLTAIVSCAQKNEEFSINIEEDPVAYIKYHIIFSLLGMKQQSDCLLERMWLLFDRVLLSADQISWIWETFGLMDPTQVAPYLSSAQVYVQIMAWQIINAKKVGILDEKIEEYLETSYQIGEHTSLKRVVELRFEKYDLDKGYNDDIREAYEQKEPIYEDQRGWNDDENRAKTLAEVDTGFKGLAFTSGWEDTSNELRNEVNKDRHTSMINKTNKSKIGEPYKTTGPTVEDLLREAEERRKQQQLAEECQAQVKKASEPSTAPRSDTKTAADLANPMQAALGKKMGPLNLNRMSAGLKLPNDQKPEQESLKASLRPIRNLTAPEPEWALDTSTALENQATDDVNNETAKASMTHRFGGTTTQPRSFSANPITSSFCSGSSPNFGTLNSKCPVPGPDNNPSSHISSLSTNPVSVVPGKSPIFETLKPTKKVPDSASSLSSNSSIFGTFKPIISACDPGKASASHISSFGVSTSTSSPSNPGNMQAFATTASTIGINPVGFGFGIPSPFQQPETSTSAFTSAPGSSIFIKLNSNPSEGTTTPALASVSSFSTLTFQAPTQAPTNLLNSSARFRSTFTPPLTNAPTIFGAGAGYVGSNDSPPQFSDIAGAPTIDFGFQPGGQTPRVERRKIAKMKRRNQ